MGAELTCALMAGALLVRAALVAGFFVTTARGVSLERRSRSISLRASPRAAFTDASKAVTSNSAERVFIDVGLLSLTTTTEEEEEETVIPDLLEAVSAIVEGGVGVTVVDSVGFSFCGISSGKKESTFPSLTFVG